MFEAEGCEHISYEPFFCSWPAFFKAFHPFPTTAEAGLIVNRLVALGLLLVIGGIQAQAVEQQKNRLNVQLDEQSIAIEYRLWSGHPYVRMKDTYRLGWSPYLDPFHKLADLAQCIRLEFDSTRVIGVWTSSSVRGATLGGELPRLPVPTRTVQYEMWLPIDSVAKLMGYKVTFDAKKQLLSLTSYPYADDLPFLEPAKNPYAAIANQLLKELSP